MAPLQPLALGPSLQYEKEATTLISLGQGYFNTRSEETYSWQLKCSTGLHNYLRWPKVINVHKRNCLSSENRLEYNCENNVFAIIVSWQRSTAINSFNGDLVKIVYLWQQPLTWRRCRKVQLGVSRRKYCRLLEWLVMRSFTVTRSFGTASFNFSPNVLAPCYYDNSFGPHPYFSVLLF